MVQDVIIEVQYKETASPALALNAAKPNTSALRSVYVGWTGMASATKAGPTIEKSRKRGRDDAGLVEIDATFGRMLGLVDGQKVVGCSARSLIKLMISGQCAAAFGSPFGTRS